MGILLESYGNFMEFLWNFYGNFYGNFIEQMIQVNGTKTFFYACLIHMQSFIKIGLVVFEKSRHKVTHNVQF